MKNWSIEEQIEIKHEIDNLAYACEKKDKLIEHLTSRLDKMTKKVDQKNFELELREMVEKTLRRDIDELSENILTWKRKYKEVFTEAYADRERNIGIIGNLKSQIRNLEHELNFTNEENVLNKE